MWTADKRYYLAADGQTVVDESDPRAHSLLVGAGGTLSAADVRRYGLDAPAAAPKAEPAPDEDADGKPDRDRGKTSQDKAVRGPLQDEPEAR